MRPAGALPPSAPPSLTAVGIEGQANLARLQSKKNQRRAQQSEQTTITSLQAARAAGLERPEQPFSVVRHLYSNANWLESFGDPRRKRLRDSDLSPYAWFQGYLFQDEAYEAGGEEASVFVSVLRRTWQTALVWACVRCVRNLCIVVAPGVSEADAGFDASNVPSNTFAAAIDAFLAWLNGSLDPDSMGWLSPYLMGKLKELWRSGGYAKEWDWRLPETIVVQLLDGVAVQIWRTERVSQEEGEPNTYFYISQPLLQTETVLRNSKRRSGRLAQV